MNDRMITGPRHDLANFINRIFRQMYEIPKREIEFYVDKYEMIIGLTFPLEMIPVRLEESQ